MQFFDAFPNEEQTAEEEHEILQRKRLSHHGEERLRHVGQHEDQAQQKDPRDEREHQPHRPRLALLLGGQLSREDRDEDDVVHPQNDF
jgi:hypothetical protein